jgi:hypothetical protein
MGYLITYTPIVPVTVEAVSFYSNTLGESVFPLFKTKLVPLFWTALQEDHHVPER